MKNSVFSKTSYVWLIAGVCCLLWGSAFPMIKIGYKMLGIDTSSTGDIILFAGVRFFIAGLLTLLFYSINNKTIPRITIDMLPRIGVLSLFQTILQYIFFYLGLAYTTGAKASIINGSSTFIALLVSSLIFRQEKLKANKIIGTVIGFVGIVVAGISSLNKGTTFQIGDVLILLSATSYAFSSVLMKKYSKNYNPAVLSGTQFVFGGAVMTVVGIIVGGKFVISNYRGVAIIFYLAMVSAVAYTIWSILLKYNDVSKIAVCGSMTPIFGFLLSYILLRENGSNFVNNLAGLLFVVVGMIVVNIRQKNKTVQ